MGFIRVAIPYNNWYSVQMEAGQGFQYCCQLSSTGLQPAGVRCMSTLPVGARVLVLKMAGMSFGVILGVVPSLSAAVNSNFLPDKINYGSGVGFMVDGAYSAFIKYLSNKGFVQDFSCGRPLDGTGSGEFGYMSETGIGLFMDSFQAYLRVNETCGLFLNYFDSYMRLAGWNMDWQTVSHERQIRDDEGEIADYEGMAVYPWESVGSLDPKTGMLTMNTNDQGIQYQGLTSKLEPTYPDTQPFYRCQRYGGYLGQGGRRALIVPGRTGGVQRYQDVPKTTLDRGLFDESVGLDGSYLLRSAHSISFTKRVNIPVPKRIRLPEDQRNDSDNTQNYKASGQFGSGPPHQVGNLPVQQAPDPAPLFGAATTNDFRAYNGNWKALHPFAYHTGDFNLPQESDSGWSNQAKLDFSRLTGTNAASSLPLPPAKQLNVDSRYGQTDFFQSESYIHQLPDGGVVFGDGYGSEISMTGGNIYMSCPGSIYMMPGRNLVAWAGDDLIARARNSIDITATNKDVRIKAQANMQMQAVGVLVESTGSGPTQGFDGKIGENVQSSGILLKSKAAPLSVWTAGVYISTGVGDVASGNIILDAGQGAADVQINARDFDRFITNVSRDIFGSNGNIQQVNLYSGIAAIICTPLTINGTTAVLSGGMLVSGNVDVTGEVSTPAPDGRMGVLEGRSLSEVTNDLSKDNQSAQSVVQDGQKSWGYFSQAYYQTGEQGDKALVPQIGFSYRDDGIQYGTQSFMLVESRWQRMVRAGDATGGSPWNEKGITYQNNQLYPFPGLIGFGTSSQAMLSPAASTLTGPNGVAVDRTASQSNPYTSNSGLPATGSWQKFSLNTFLSLG
jgi:hypothetical protein